MNENIKKAFKILKETPELERGKKLAELHYNGEIAPETFTSLIESGVVDKMSAYEALKEFEKKEEPKALEEEKIEVVKAPEETIDSQSLAPFFNEMSYETAVDNANMYLSKGGSIKTPEDSNLEDATKEDGELENFREKLELIEEDLKGFGVLSAESMRTYMQENLDKTIEKIRNEISSEDKTIPAEIEKIVGQYDEEIAKISKELKTIEENEKTRIDKISSLNEERKEIVNRQDDYHFSLQKIYEEIKNSSDEESKKASEVKVNDLKESHNSDEIRLQLITQELTELEQAQVTDAEIKNYENIREKLTEAKETLLKRFVEEFDYEAASTNLKILSDQREIYESLVSQGNIDFYSDLTSIKNEENLASAQEGLKKVLSKVETMNKLYDKMGEEILLYEQNKEFLQNQTDEDYKIRVSLQYPDDEYRTSIEKEIDVINDQINDKFNNMSSDNFEAVIVETYPLINKKNDLLAKLDKVSKKESTLEKERVIELNSLRESDKKSFDELEKMINFLNIEREKYNVKELEKKIENILDFTPKLDVDFKNNFMFDLRTKEEVEKDIITFLTKHNLTEDDEDALIKYANFLPNGYINMNNQTLVNFMKEKELSEQDLYEYKNLETHYKAKDYFEYFGDEEELQNDDKKFNKFINKIEKKEISELDRTKLKNITLIDENGKERTSFPELREMCYRTEVPVDYLVDVAKREQSVKRGGLIKEEKPLSEKLKKIFTPKRIISYITTLLILIGIKKIQINNDKENEMEGLEALKAAGEKVTEIKIETPEEAENASETIYNVGENFFVPESSLIGGTINTDVFDHSGDNEEIIDETDPTLPGAEDPSNPDVEDPAPSAPNGIEEDEFWSFSDGKIAYDGTVTIIIDGKTYTAKLPEEEMTYVNGKLVIDGPIFDIISQANSINAAYQNGNGVLKLIDLKEKIENEPVQVEEENNTPIDKEETQSEKEEVTTPGTYDPTLENVEDKSDLTEEEKNDAIDSVLDELNNSELELSALDYYASEEGNAIDYNNAYLESSSLLNDIQKAKANAEETKAMLQNGAQIDYSEDASVMDSQNMSR